MNISFSPFSTFSSLDSSALITQLAPLFSSGLSTGLNPSNFSLTNIGNISGSSSTITFQGSRFDKTIVSGGGNDFIQSGAGNDTITGGLGADTFAFTFPTDGVDVITDFSIEQGDKIQVSGAGFGMSAADISRFFAYNPVDGGLFFGTTQIATLPINLGFNATVNIVVV